MTLTEDNSLATRTIGAIRNGDLETLTRLLAENEGLANATIIRQACGKGPDYAYPLIGAATDWPGHFPNVAAAIAALVQAGADPNASAQGPHQETALHGAASSDDVEALDALLDAGADIEAPGAVIAGGTPLDDAVAFGQWASARRLVERGAKTALWHAAALGLIDRVKEHFSSGTPRALYSWGDSEVSPAEDVNVAFWCACHGGSRRTAEFLLTKGAQLNWVSPWDGLTPLGAARRSQARDLVLWLESIGAKDAGL